MFLPLRAIQDALALLEQLLPDGWTVIADSAGFHFLLMSSSSSITKCIQRQIYLMYNGSVSVIVHCKTLPSENEISKLHPAPVVFQDEQYQKFCEKGLAMCWSMTQFQVCTGANHQESKHIWSSQPDSYVDLNPYLESKYESSCRSNQCHFLIPLRLNTLRCQPCSKIQKILKERTKFASEGTVKPNTPNIYLTPEQSQAKLKEVHEAKRKAEKRASYLQSKLKNLLEKEGVDVDEEQSQYFRSILEKADLNPMQKMFLEEQLKSASLSDSRGHRWHPAMIRLAIKIKNVSSSAYDILRDSGAVNFPHPRTLLDYTSCISSVSGVNPGLLEMVSTQVSKFKEPYEKYCALIFDEVFISQNLVYRKSDGALIGYVYLDDVDKEIARFDSYLQGKTELESLPLASKILAYMVKGLTSHVKCVIASYPCKDMDKTMLFSRTWEVIAQCEGAGVPILSLVCDGSPTNRSFFKLHTPINPRASGIVYDTINIYAPDNRPLFLIADVAHLLKTIRNCLHKSRENEGSQYRHMEINGQKLLWKYIVRLYYTYRGNSLRQCFKLNAQNVFPNSYSTMRVKYAAEVLSQTVANALKILNWPGTEELINFIEKINKFFDILNGAHSSQTKKKLNDDLAPYTDIKDARFEWLQKEFWNDYLESWRIENEELDMEPKERAKTILSYQTLQGIETTIWGFTGAVKYLLQKGARFVMARAFSQDPLEQHFSQQREKGGGNTNPNVQMFQRNQVNIAIAGQLKTRRRKANIEDDLTPSDVSAEPLPKRQRKQKQKFTTDDD